MVEFFAKDSDDFFKKWRLCERTECVDSKNTHYHQHREAAPAPDGYWRDANNGGRQWQSSAASRRAAARRAADPYERKIGDLAKKAKKLFN